MENFLLKYDHNHWTEEIVSPVNTLQLFITNKCNLRCRGCFYAHKLGKNEMTFAEYKKYIQQYKNFVKKMILLGGEPTLHKDLPRMIDFNAQNELETTVYSNGINLNSLRSLNYRGLRIRIGIYGAYSSEKPLMNVPLTDLPLTIVYMLRQDNTFELFKAVEATEKRFNCSDFYISSIRDIATTNDYWKDTPETIPVYQYATLIQEFINAYNGRISKLHLATRGILVTDKQDFMAQERCRFGNIFPDKEKIICPLDISKKILAPSLIFDKRPCTKHQKCILQKIVLKTKDCK